MIKINPALRKIFYTKFLILSIAMVVFFLIQKKVKQLDGKRIALIEKIEGNYVFRGNNPFIVENKKTTFAHKELTAHFNEILKQLGQKQLDDYYLIDVSLLEFDQYRTINSEKKFFVEHPDYGQFMALSTLSPSLLLGKFSDSNVMTTTMKKNYQLWMTKNLKEIHKMALVQKDKPTVIYIHCDSGRDRTGLMVASYRMLFNDMSLSEARSENIKEAGRNSVDIFDQAMKSYCFYVKKTYNKPENFCV